MSVWTDALDNVKHGLLAMWFAFSPMVQGMLLGFVMGSILMGGFVVWVML